MAHCVISAPKGTNFRNVWSLLLLLLSIFFARITFAAGVTIITHGFAGNVDDWIIPMTQKIPRYNGFPGSTNFTCYEVYFVEPFFGAGYFPTQARIGGVTPTNSQTAEIFIKLDWSPLAISLLNSATDIAASVTPLLLSTNFIPELGGRSLAELPIHLIGHSRGASVISEISRLLGMKGIWVDDMTFLDAHPVGVYGDANVDVYRNVLFADNYWQTNFDSFCPNGQRISGAYNRYLSNLLGGYACPHSNVHLWYHGTIDGSTPTSDTRVSLTESERATWWTPSELRGTNAGFYYSLLGKGDRLSTNEPSGLGSGAIRDGYNQFWDFGVGVASNRTRLPDNDGSWPNVIKFDVIGTNELPVGETTLMKYYYQFGKGPSERATIRFYLDRDVSPLNSNAVKIKEVIAQASGTNTVHVG
ncbi:MAG: hypothetical protein MN733_40365, partial [Nitrososphaera sp.]|nr:hypothetical protein [Nitrososphaera sp.]